MSRGAQLDAISARIASARVAEDLYGPLVGGQAYQLEVLEKLYRKLVSVVHPDHFRSSLDAVDAVKAFMRATELRDQAKAKIAAGTYGDRAAQAATAPKMPTVIRVRDRSYTVGDVIARGDLCDLYACTHNREELVFKLAMSAADNDLVENEGKMLARLYPPRAKDEAYYRYLPRFHDSFAYRGTTNKSARRVNVLARAGGYVTIAEVARAYPAGLDFRDVVWMLKRGLSALGFVHGERIVHGAVLPEHLLVHPTTHGAKIVDWCYAVERGQPIRAISKRHRASYPPEVLAKQPARPATDIFMLVTMMRSLMRAPPEPLDRFLRGCLLPAIAKRPDSAWALHQELDELLTALVGERKYRPLAMPAQGD